ncbi:MAG: hypothetical protein WBC73_00680 [Phormidesmis sp.]
MQGREGGGLKELVQQLGDFQAKSHHQCLVTGRPLALQGVDRMLSQTNNFMRVRLEPMTDAHAVSAGAATPRKPLKRANVCWG